MSTKQDRLLSTIHKFVSIFMKWPTCLLKEEKQYTNQASNEYDIRRYHSNIIQTKSGNFYT